MVREALATLEEGVNFGGVLIKYVRYADDQATLPCQCRWPSKTDGTDGPSG